MSMKTAIPWGGHEFVVVCQLEINIVILLYKLLYTPNVISDLLSKKSNLQLLIKFSAFYFYAFAIINPQLES